MKLLTHNLMCCVKCHGFPLRITADDVAGIDAAYDGLFVRKMLPRLEYPVLRDAFRTIQSQQRDMLGHAAPLPDSIEAPPPPAEGDSESTTPAADLTDGSPDSRAIFFALQSIAIKEGQLTCPQCSLVYPIKDFIPNMIPPSA